MNIEGIDIIIINSGDSNRISTFQRVIRSVIFSLCSVYFVIFKKFDNFFYTKIKSIILPLLLTTFLYRILFQMYYEQFR